MQLAGEIDSAGLLELADLLLAIGEHDPAVNVIGAPHSAGTAWLRVTDRGLALLAIAPDVIDTYRIIPATELFGPSGWPSTWQTKARLARAKAERDNPGYEVGWACCMRADKTVQACRVQEYDGDKLLSILVSDDMPPASPASYGFDRWWPIGQHAEGLEKLWERQKAVAHNYGLLCLYATAASKAKVEKPKAYLPGSKRMPHLDSTEQSRRARKAWETRRANMAKKAGGAPVEPAAAPKPENPPAAEFQGVRDVRRGESFEEWQARQKDQAD